MKSYKDGIGVQFYEADEAYISTIPAHSLVSEPFTFFRLKGIYGILENEAVDMDRSYTGLIYFIELNLYAIFI